MAGLAAEVAALAVPKLPTCSFVGIYAGLDDEDRAALTDLIAGPTPAGAIAGALTARGFDVGDSTVRRHRNGKCSCGRAR